uniref:No apical meristem-associated C-terminal domain-containing protein n=1 Tax=Quercus lobata TaxID=97700 RepID=A0A7N2MP08_QUELO
MLVCRCLYNGFEVISCLAHLKGIFLLLLLDVVYTINEAKEAYLKVQTIPFKFDHFWNILRHQSKWLELIGKPQMIRKSTATSSPSTLESIHLGEDEVSHASFVDLVRPSGIEDENE